MGLELCPLVLLVHLARFVVVLMGSPFPITDPAPTMFLPVLGEPQREISHSPWLLSLTGWCFPPLALVMTIRLCVVGHKREEVCIFMIFRSHVLPAGRRLSIHGPWIFTSVSADCWIFLDGAGIGILAAFTIPIAVTVLNVSLVLQIKVQFDTHVLDYSVQAHAGWDHLHLSFFPRLHSTLLTLRKRPPAVSPNTSTYTEFFMEIIRSGSPRFLQKYSMIRGC